DNVKTRLSDAAASVTAVVQDCLTLARVRKAPEWQVYFELQLSGVREGQKREHLPPTWRGDPRKFSWQPAETFAVDRATRDGKLNGHALETVELMIERLAHLMGDRRASGIR